MRAAVYYEPGDIHVEDRPSPVPERDNLIVEILCCAICGTNLTLTTTLTCGLSPGADAVVCPLCLPLEDIRHGLGLMKNSAPKF